MLTKSDLHKIDFYINVAIYSIEIGITEGVKANPVKYDQSYDKKCISEAKELLEKVRKM